MRPFSRLTAGVAVIDRPDVDTDQIIPAAWLKRVERTGFGAGLFEAWRADPAFGLNAAAAAEAKILIGRGHFGCGPAPRPAGPPAAAGQRERAGPIYRGSRAIGGESVVLFARQPVGQANGQAREVGILPLGRRSVSPIRSTRRHEGGAGRLRPPA